MGDSKKTKEHKIYSGLSEIFNLQQCPVCGKDYIIQSRQWVYKRHYDKHLHYFCSYGCMRKALKERGLD